MSSRYISVVVSMFAALAISMSLVSRASAQQEATDPISVISPDSPEVSDPSIPDALLHGAFFNSTAIQAGNKFYAYTQAAFGWEHWESLEWGDCWGDEVVLFEM